MWALFAAESLGVPSQCWDALPVSWSRHPAERRDAPVCDTSPRCSGCWARCAPLGTMDGDFGRRDARNREWHSGDAPRPLCLPDQTRRLRTCGLLWAAAILPLFLPAAAQGAPCGCPLRCPPPGPPPTTSTPPSSARLPCRATAEVWGAVGVGQWAEPPPPLAFLTEGASCTRGKQAEQPEKQRVSISDGCLLPSPTSSLEGVLHIGG